MPVPTLDFDLPYDGQPTAITVIAAALLALKNAILYALSPPQARVYHSANQSIANTTIVALAFNSERWDTDSIHSTSTNSSRLTCNTAGLYEIDWSVEFASNAAGIRTAAVRLNGATLIKAPEMAAVSGNTTKVGGTTQYQLIVGDYVELVVYQTSGGSLNVPSTGNYSPEFGMVKVG